MSSKILEETFKEIDQAIEEQAENAQISLATVKTIIYHQRVQAGDKKRVLNYELPYGEWLKDLMEKFLAPSGYSVTHQKNANPIAMANEYIMCKTDLVVYHPSNCNRNVKLLHICIQRDTLEDMGCQLDFCNISVLVAELKVASADTKAENECFYNMFGEAVKLILKTLQRGKLIVKVTVYEITVATHRHRFARLQSLEIDLENSTCVFKQSGSTAPFHLLLNRIISILDH